MPEVSSLPRMGATQIAARPFHGRMLRPRNQNLSVFLTDDGRRHQNTEMTKKKIVITLSRVFPTTHSRKGSQPASRRNSNRATNAILSEAITTNGTLLRKKCNGAATASQSVNGRDARITHRKSRSPKSTSLSASSG